MVKWQLEAAWKFSDVIEDGHDLAAVAAVIALIQGVDTQTVLDDLLDALERNSDFVLGDRSHPTHCLIGKIELDEWTVYWIANNAYEEWTSDEPDWWQEQIDQLREQGF